jgi:hypothetical protein
MKFGRALLAPSWLAACLMTQGCVEYIPENGPAGPPPPAPAQYLESPPAPPVPPAAPAPPQAEEGGLDALLAPIALYPDPLIAVILPASTAPSDISSAAAYLVQYADATQIDSQPWDPSVRALAHYPGVLTWMAGNMAWTRALGAAFISSPSDVMASVQRLRARAMASGALAPSPQEQVVSEDGEIEIIPAEADAICVPFYDPDLVYADGPYGGPPIYFGPEYPMGIWLSYYVDWHRRAVWDAGPHARRGPGGWYDPRQNGGRPPEGARPWHSPSGPHSAPAPGGTPVPHPRPMPGAPNPPARPGESGPPAAQQRGGTGPREPSSGLPPLVRAPRQEGVRSSPGPAHPAPSRVQAPAAAAPAESRDRDPQRN